MSSNHTAVVYGSFWDSFSRILVLLIQSRICATGGDFATKCGPVVDSIDGVSALIREGERLFVFVPVERVHQRLWEAMDQFIGLLDGERVTICLVSNVHDLQEQVRGRYKDVLSSRLWIVQPNHLRRYLESAGHLPDAIMASAYI
ncbi:hypothetical protein KJ766_02785 [Patescibacteria group bacterium]|nr:hypothetical protein [Patescibacteria group bacterium]